jgi:hypothetical protein
MTNTLEESLTPAYGAKKASIASGPVRATEGDGRMKTACVCRQPGWLTFCGHALGQDAILDEDKATPVETTGSLPAVIDLAPM